MIVKIFVTVDGKEILMVTAVSEASAPDNFNVHSHLLEGRSRRFFDAIAHFINKAGESR